MTHLLFVRHGQDVDNAISVLNGRRQGSLTALGQQQAARAARRLSLLRPDVLYVSPLERTKQTGEIISVLLGIKKVLYTPELIERDFGILTGKSYQDIPKFATQWVELPGYRYFISGQGVEPMDEVRNRVQRFYDYVLTTHPNERVLVISHGDVYKMFIAVAERLSIDEALQTPFIENAEIVDFGIIS